MRRLATGERIRELFRRLGQRTRQPATIYVTGGATAVLLGWRESTIDVDLKLVPDRDELLRLIPELKESLEINIELASPDLFIPVPPGWEERSPWETTEGPLVVRHFDLTSQALSKVERWHDRDRFDVSEMIRLGLVTTAALRDCFESIEPLLFRFPAIDAESLRRRVEQVVADHAADG